MYKEKKKNNIFKRIVAFLGATFTAIACLFAFNLNTDDDKLNVYADEVVSNGYEFIGSNLFSLMSPSTYNNSDDWYYLTGLLYMCNVSFEFSSINGTSIDSFTVNLDFDDYPSTFSQTFSNISSLGVFPLLLDGYIHPSYNSLYFVVGYQFEPADSNYDLRTFKKPIGFNYYSKYLNSSYQVFVEYFDTDNNLLILDWTFSPYGVFDQDNLDGIVMQKRTYYFSDALDITDSGLYNQGYRDGESYGYNLGYESGHSEGYREAYGLGKNEGYNIGKNEVLNNSDIFSFNNLLTSVIDVPVKAFTSLFNFEILGVNLSGFFLGLLTCCIVIGVIRFIL